MGINYSIDAEARIVRLTHVGESPIEEYEATLTAIFRSPLYSPGFGFLVDRRGFDTPPAPFVEELNVFLAQNRAAIVGARWAVVTRSLAGHGMARMGQALAEAKGTVTVGIFKSLDDAERWLRETT